MKAKKKRALKWEEGFKLVRVSGRQLRSWGEETAAGVTYKVGSITRPKVGCGPLAVMRSRKSAEAVGDLYNDDNRLYSCLYAPSRRRRLIDSNKEVTHVDQCLPGTVLADAVKLVKLVKEIK